MRPRLHSASLPAVERAQATLDRAAAVFEPEAQECWLDTLDYTIHYDEDSILDVSFRAFGSGAYPSTLVTHVAIDLRSGEALTAEAVFEHDRLSELLALVQRRAHESWQRALSQGSAILTDVPETRPSLEDLDHFLVQPDGLVFLFDYALPHVIETATPNSELWVATSDLRRFLRRGSAIRK